VFATLLGRPATAFAAPGWQCTAYSLAAIDAAGLRYHSSTRGTAPYRPMAGGRVFATPAVPTTWPTLDGTYGVVGTTAAALTPYYLAQVRAGLTVHTLHAEVEGRRCCRCSRRCSMRYRAVSSSCACSTPPRWRCVRCRTGRSAGAPGRLLCRGGNNDEQCGWRRRGGAG